MAIIAPSNTITIYQTVLSNQFTEYRHTVTDSSQKAYDLGFQIQDGTDVVLINGLYQIRGTANSYTVGGSVITFNADTALSVGDDIAVYYEKVL